MGMGIYSSNSNVKVYTIKNPDGSAAGTIRITKSAKKKPKPLRYNFKYISSKILMSKTSDSAGKALVTARVNIGVLQRKLKTGDFDDKEVELAIIHAKKMERIARKKLQNLQKEETAKQQASCQDKINARRISESKNTGKEKMHEISEKELRKLRKELQELMKKNLKKTANELTGSVHNDMEPNDLELLKKKHRANELWEIMEADRKYLQALFNKLQREKEEVSKENCSYGSEGVSLELSGSEVPVQTPETPIMGEGGNINLSI